MVDTYDTPMMDFNEDSDMGMLSAENHWVMQAPARMEEDGHMQMLDGHGFAYDTGAAYTEALEVDMDGYEPLAEYEMLDDDNHAVAASGADIVDADVYDVSLNPSPNVMPVPDLTAGYVHEEPHNIHRAVPEPVTVTPADTVSSSNVDESHVESQDHAPLLTENGREYTNADAYALEVPEAVSTYPESPALEAKQDDEETAYHDYEAVQKVAFDHQGADTVPEATEPVKPTVGGTIDRPLPLDAVGSHSSHHESTEEETRLEANQVLQASHSIAEEVTTSDAAGVETHSEQAVYSEQLVDIPPVLLSLRLTSLDGEQPEFTLFSTAPGASDHPDDESPVLLQHIPTLFYQPISTLFDVLRHEDYFSHFDELLEAEMALNVYDLQLLISEVCSKP